MKSLISYKKHEWKRKVAWLLLFSFLNINTFLPAAQFNFEEPAVKSLFTSPVGDDAEGVTILEFLLESAGLKDYLPDSEKQDFSYDYFSARNSIFVLFFPMVLMHALVQLKQFVLATKQNYQVISAQSLPKLQYHQFIFRLTPF